VEIGPIAGDPGRQLAARFLQRSLTSWRAK
jgi:hypothetical protein